MTVFNFCLFTGPPVPPRLNEFAKAVMGLDRTFGACPLFGNPGSSIVVSHQLVSRPLSVDEPDGTRSVVDMVVAVESCHQASPSQIHSQGPFHPTASTRVSSSDYAYAISDLLLMQTWMRCDHDGRHLR